MLGRLFVAATADTNNNDVHDRALFYYRLLMEDVNEVVEVTIDSGAAKSEVGGGRYKGCLCALRASTSGWRREPPSCKEVGQRPARGGAELGVMGSS